MQVTGKKSFSKKPKYKLNNFYLVFGYIFIISFCAVTSAKYTTSISEKDSIAVAKWEVSAGDMEKSFDLFSKSEIYELPQGVSNIAELTTEEIDEDIAKNKKIIAPGTWGKLDIEITNDSEVAVQYDFSLTNIETNLPIYLSVDGENWYEASGIDNLLLKKETLYLDESKNTTKTITLYWKWDYNVSSAQDEEDTQKAKNGESCKVSAQVTFTQIEP